MNNLRTFPVYIFIFVIHSIFRASEATFLSNWTTLLWVKAEARVSPLDVWTNSSYTTGASNLDITLKSLLSANRTAFRSGKIDNWSVWVPSRLRLLYLSETGSALRTFDFDTRNDNITDWFSAARLRQTSLPSRDWQLDIRYVSTEVLKDHIKFEVTFAIYSQPEEVFGLYAGALRYDSKQYFLFSSNGSLLHLPGRDLGCKFLSSTLSALPKIQNFTYNRWNLCASFCRQHNFTYSFLYGMSCGCNNTELQGPNVTCTTPCPGNNLEICGDLTYVVVVVNTIENVVNDAAFNPNTFDDALEWTFNGTHEFDLGSPLYFRYGSITVPGSVTNGSNLTLELSHKLVACNDYTEEFYIMTINITVTGTSTNISLGETLGIACAKLKLENTTGIVNYNVTLKASYTKGPALLTAPILAVQAAWEMCDCDCWVYHMLYGESPYKNMTYAEKEEALQEAIAKMKKELTVNTSELSATIRKKTSAEDSRVSAVVVGYTLGVAIISFYLGSILLFDLPRLLEGFRALLRNLTGR